jgi:hypothetical protein
MDAAEFLMNTNRASDSGDLQGDVFPRSLPKADARMDAAELLMNANFRTVISKLQAEEAAFCFIQKQIPRCAGNDKASEQILSCFTAGVGRKAFQLTEGGMHV